MIKVNLTESWDWDTPAASLVDVHSRGIDRTWMVKRAAEDTVAQAFAGVTPQKNHSLIHLLAMGDADRYGPNRNGDFFYKSARQLELLDPNWDKVYLPRMSKKAGSPQYHTKSADTFTDRTEVGNQERAYTFAKYAKVYADHKNKPFPHKDPETGRDLPPDPIIGNVKAAAHNARMGRVELLVEVPHGRDWDEHLEKLARGKDIPFSMSCKVPYDVCSVCGHKAKTGDEYCNHLAQNLTALDKSGHITGAVNDWMTFFDISRVHRPADRIAWSLVKAASASPRLAADLALDPEYLSYPDISVLAQGNPALAHRYDLQAKAAQIEKEIPVLAKTPAAKGIPSKASADHLAKVASMRADHLNNVPAALRALSDAGVCLPMDAWAVLTLGTQKAAAVAADLRQAREVLPRVYTQYNPAENLAYEPDRSLPGPHLRKVASELARDFGVLPEQVQSRAVQNVLTGQPAPVLVKRASVVSPAGEALAREYAAYQLSFVDTVRRNRPLEADLALQTCVLQNVL